MAFATADDVGTRLGRDLTEAEEATAELVIELVQGLVADAVSKDAAWATALSPIPSYLKLLAIEKAVGAITNPNGVAVSSETIGSYSYETTYPRATDQLGIFLTDEEERSARFAVWGTNTASVMLGSHFQEVDS